MASIFKEDWHSGVNSPAWKEAVSFYVDLANKYGPPGVVGNGFNENLALMSEGKCAMWNDATVAAGVLFDPKRSKVADKIGFAQNPIEKWNKGGSWLWAWSLGIPASSKQADEAKKFIEWATSKDYIKMIGEKEGWVTIPPGTRKSTYENADYLKVAPFAKPTLKAIEDSKMVDNTMHPKALRRHQLRGHSRDAGDQQLYRPADRRCLDRQDVSRPSDERGRGQFGSRHGEGQVLQTIARRSAQNVFDRGRVT